MREETAKHSGLALLAMLLTTGSLLPLHAEGSSAAAQVAFAHGVVAFHHDRYEEAASLLEEASHNDPAEGTYLHWLAIAYLRLGKGTEAADRLERSLKTERPPASGRWRVLSDLRRVRRSLKRHQALPEIAEPAGLPRIRFPGEAPRWRGQINLESAYDSNPRLLAEDLGIPVSGVAPGDVPGDAAALLDVRIDHQPVWNRNGWSLGLSVEGHQSLHPVLGDTDLSVVQGTASLTWGRSPGGSAEGPLGTVRVPKGRGPVFLLQGGGTNAWLGGEDLLESWDLGAAVIAGRTARTETRLGAGWRDRGYSGGAGGALQRGDETETSVALDQVVFFKRQGRIGRGRSLRLGIEAGEVDADRTFAESFTEARLEAGLPLSGGWRLSLFGARRDEKYDHPESNVGNPFGPPRHDTTWRAGATALWEATSHLSWIVRGMYVWRDSNVELPPGSPLLDYQRTIVSSGFRWVF